MESVPNSTISPSDTRVNQLIGVPLRNVPLWLSVSWIYHLPRSHQNRQCSLLTPAKGSSILMLDLKLQPTVMGLELGAKIVGGNSSWRLLKRIEGKLSMWGSTGGAVEEIGGFGLRVLEAVLLEGGRGGSVEPGAT